MSIPKVFVLHVSCARRRASKLSQLLFEVGAQGVEGQELSTEDVTGGLCSRLIVYASDEGLQLCAAALSRLQADPSWHPLDFERIELSSDWAVDWTRHLEPLELTSALTLRPLALQADGSPSSPPEVSDGSLWLQAGLAFGYGDHPTTRMAASWLEHRCFGERVLDFGTGTGVLALVALRFGAAFAKGTDIDAESLRIAQHNAQINRLHGRCEFSCAALDDLEDDFGVVVANVDVQTLCISASSLAQRLRPGGQLLLTGVTSEQLPQLSQAFAAAGVSLRCEAEELDWVLLSGARLPLAHSGD